MRIKPFSLVLLLVGMTLVLMLSGVVHAAIMTPAQETQAIQNLEDTLLATRYDQEALDARLGRLEGIVFGEAQGSLSPEARISRLQTALSPKTLGALSPMSKPAPASTANSATPQANRNTMAKTSAVQPSPQSGPWNSQAGRNSSNSLANPASYMQPMQQSAKPVPGETDYPTVSRMEEKVLGRNYVQEDITRRLERLEKQVFKTVQNGPLADRVDNLKLMVLGDTGNTQATATQPYQQSYGYPQPAYPARGAANQTYTQVPSGQAYAAAPNDFSNYSRSTGSNYGNAYTGTPISNTQTDYGQPQPGVYQPTQTAPYGQDPNDSAYGAGGQPTPDMLAAMNEVEKQVLGHTYPSEPMDTRLGRLETKIFKTTSPEMSSDDRMQRVIAVSSAGGAPQTTGTKVKNTAQILLPIILTILPMLLL
ncbi:MAG TPA: hypothetical protein V6C52_06405 [Coleofasciculaceae cyanobacterium]|jgi:hypothetical protein